MRAPPSLASLPARPMIRRRRRPAIPPSPTDSVGHRPRSELKAMSRGVTYLVVGILAGAALTGASHGVLNAATAIGTSGVPLFTEVFDKVRANYAEKPDDDKLV